MKTTLRGNAKSAFTLVELLAVIVLVVIAAGLCLPVITGPMKVSCGQTKALSNAKQIALALRLYAGDHNGEYPSFTLLEGNPSASPVPDSNTAFAQLFPTYVQQESIFWVQNSAFCSSNPPDELTDMPPADTPINTLKRGENAWAYVLRLTDRSNPKAPLVASGFADPVSHTYSRDPLRRGGALLQGERVVVVDVDGSGMVVKINPLDMTVHGSNGGSVPGDIFTTSHAANGWLAPENVVVNPK